MHHPLSRVSMHLVTTLCLFGLLLSSAPLMAGDYLLTTLKPNRLVLVDAKARRVVRDLEIPAPGSPISIATSPDGRIAYVMTNHLSSISGVDLDSGKEVFRADFDEPGKRIKGMAAMDISPDGKELFVMQSVTRMQEVEMVVEDPRIAVYRTDAGLQAKPTRLLPSPRRTAQLYLNTAGDRLYAVSWDIQVLDPQTGKVLDTLKATNWERPNYAPPDFFGVWNQYEQTQVYINPYYTLRTDMSPEDPAAWKTGMITLDLKTGEFRMDDFEETAAIMFSSVVNPVNRDEAFSVYTQLTKTDLANDRLVKRVDLEHTYYTINISADGKEVYLGGTMNDIAIYSTETLEKIGSIDLPGDADMGTSWVRVIQR